jgi:guanosine-3',5'-bis(diphosphate) 3'-pyrophosphohydrolase
MEERRELFLEFVTKCHDGQVRKYTGEPYIVHPLAVANKVDHIHPLAWEIALAHDVVEDTPYTSKDIYEFVISDGLYNELDAAVIKFGVEQLTDIYTAEDYPEMGRDERKTNEAIRLGNTSPVIQSIKYADLIDNTDSILKYDLDFSQVYLHEKETLLSKMRVGDFKLFMEAICILNSGLKTIKGRCKIKNLKVGDLFYYKDGFIYEYQGKVDGKCKIMSDADGGVIYEEDKDLIIKKVK